MYSSQLLKGTYQTIVLKLLKENGKMYGYEISQKVKEHSNGDIQLPEGSLYPILHKMAEEGWVQTEKITLGKRVRKYYSLTPVGDEEAGARVLEFENFVRTMQLILKPQSGMI